MSNPKFSQSISHNTRSRRTHRHHIIKYSNLSVILFFLGLLLIFFLSWRLAAEQRKEQRPVRMTATLPSESIPKDILLDIQDFPGLLHCWAACRVQAEIKVGSYQAASEILGVDLASWPMKITKSAGAKRRGTAPLIVAGEGFFQNLADEYGAAITKRQALVFQEKIETLDVEITFLSYPMSEDAFSAGTVPAASQTEDAFSAQGVPSAFPGSFLALAEGDGLYMDAAQMNELLEACQISSGISCIELEIKGERNAESAKKSLVEAGFIVE